jgi:CheY-like chemotaxis protein
VLATGSPGLAYKLLKKAADEHGRAMVAVSDGDAFRAMRRVARVEGFSVEPATSVAFAGLEKLLADGHIKDGETVVVNCSGHTFSAEKHALEDRYVFNLQVDSAGLELEAKEGLANALEQLDEQITSIVIIDDNPNDSRLIRRLLQRYKQYRIFEAHNGPDGIDLVRQRQPDLVLLDLTIPGMDGFSILDELKNDRRTSEIPVMIISGKDLTPDQQAFLRGNARSVFQKGNFSGSELVNHVVEMLDGEPSAEVLPYSNPSHGSIEELLNPVADFGDNDRLRILVIDDNVWDARLMRRLLEARQRYEVLEAHTAGEAMRAVSSYVPDLIILDLMLPDTNGEELLQTLHANEETKKVPVIIVSAKDIEPQLRAQLALHADSIWSKGALDRNSLLAHVETILTE